jgi:hypothetical protein
LLTSDVPEPHAVLPETSTPSPRVLSQDDLLKFFIGLRLLGEKKQKRFLEYMATLKEQTEGNTGDQTHDI